MGPALMPYDTSRDFTNYLPACSYESCLMKRYGCNSNTMYRSFVKANSERVLRDLHDTSVCHSQLS